MQPTTIAHVSDLHFRDEADIHLYAWNALCGALRQASPAIVVVTGDIADEPKRGHLEVAHRKLTALAKLLSIPFPISEQDERGILVLPGNHDVRQWGNLFQSRRAWDAVFGATVERGLWLRRRNILLYVFDSCYTRKGVGNWAPLARGAISELDLQEFDSWCATQAHGPDGDAYAYAFRIALLHHHPLPIAENETGRQRDLRPYVMMSNGAQFLRAVARQRFNLVLHGHDHCPQVAKIEVQHLDRHDPPVWVVAGGSASHPAARPAVGFTYNLVRIDLEGTARIATSVMQAVGFESNPAREISPWTERKEAILERVKERSNLEFEEVVKEVDVDYTGSADVHLRFVGGRVRPGTGAVDRMRLRLVRSLPAGFPVDQLGVKAQLSLGATTNKLDAWWERLPHAVHEPPEGPAARFYVVGDLNFPRALNETSGKFDLSIKYRVPNAIVTTAEQHKMVYGYGANHIERCEYVSMPLDTIADKLRLVVRFSPGPPGRLNATHEVSKLLGSELKPRLLIAHELAPAMESDDQSWPLRVEGQCRLHGAEAHLKPVVTEQEVNGSHEIAGEVSAPWPGARYFLQWALPCLNEKRPKDRDVVEMIGQAEFARNWLLDRPANFALPLDQQTVGPYLAGLLNAISQSPRPKVPDEVEIGIAAYDQGPRRIRFCAGHFLSDKVAEETYAVGEGVIGHAFKMKQPVLWWPRWGLEQALRTRRYVQTIPPGYGRPHEVFIAIPLLYPLDVPSPSSSPGSGQSSPGGLAAKPEWRYVVAVVVVRSATQGTPLVRYRDETLFKKLVNLAWYTFVFDQFPAIIGPHQGGATGSG